MIPDAYDANTSLPRPLRVLVVAAELSPFARAGGLGDVVHGLSRALGSIGIEIVVATPLYGCTRFDSCAQLSAWPHRLPISLGNEIREVGVFETVTDSDVRVLLLDCPPLYRRNGIYGTEHTAFPDNDLRFAVMSMAALRASEILFDGPPDIVHAHDWHAGPAVAYARHIGSKWTNTRSVLTFHNIAFQGSFPIDRAQILGFDDPSIDRQAVTSNGRINFLKAGAVFADRITTVSETYAREVIKQCRDQRTVQSPDDSQAATLLDVESELAEVLSAKADAFVGITNGVDTSAWNPSRDRALAARYDAHDPSGRHACRVALASELGLDLTDDPPIVGMVTRLTSQKGADIAIEAIPTLVEDGMRLAIIAVGDPKLQTHFEQAAQRFRRKVAFRHSFGEPIARRVYAGADMFLMPSRLEPCGLGQQYAMRYGAVPVVSPVGGLKDTVEQIHDAAGNGFWLQEISSRGIIEAIRTAATVRRDASRWSRIIKNCLTKDTSWDVSARKYYALYRELAGALPRPSVPPPNPVTSHFRQSSIPPSPSPTT